MSILYWLLVVLAALAIPLEVLLGTLVVRELRTPPADTELAEPEPGPEPGPAPRARHRARRGKDPSWIEHLYPELTPARTVQVDHRHEYSPDGPVPCWCGWGEPMPARDISGDPFAIPANRIGTGEFERIRPYAEEATP
jgi:hypothetical protein